MKKKRVYIILVLIIIAIITIVVITSKSKYKLDKQTIHTQNSDMFYFESDLLDTETKEYTYSDWNGQDEYSVKFNLYNYEDELRINTLETNYTIYASIKSQTEEDVIRAYINGNEVTSENANDNEIATGMMNKDVKQKDEIEIKVSAKDRTNMVLTVEVISTSPYSKKLSAIINITSTEEEPQYTVNLGQDDQKDYVRLLIKTNDYSGTLKIAYNTEKIRPDATNYIIQKTPELIENNYYYVEIEANSNSNYQIDFIKSDTTENITIGDNISSSDIVVGYNGN